MVIFLTEDFMALYTISDLHLPLGVNKPMDIFSSEWDNYVNRLAVNWQNTVKPDDYVVLAGDFSWATYIEQAKPDFDFLNNLNGIKFLLKGNHDYWWTTKKKLDEFITKNNFSDIHFIQNNSYLYKDIAICGSRLWQYPEGANETEENVRIYNREICRLELSLNEAMKLSSKEIILFTHYPPITQSKTYNAFTELISKYPVSDCIYGHLHAASQKKAAEGTYNNVNYTLVSCDYRHFMPIKLRD